MSVILNTLRSLMFTLYQLVLTPIYAILVLLLFWLPPLPRHRFIMGWCWLNVVGARVICGIRYRVIGEQNIPRDARNRPHIVMSKHSSTWETLALNFVFPPLAFVAKKELLSIPFFGWAFALASPITIDRETGSAAMQQIVEQSVERFRDGFWVMVYPEGTRIPVGTRKSYKTGGARLAISVNVPVIPVAHNAGYLWPNGTLGKRPGTITVSIGRPISVARRSALQLTTEVETWIETEVARLGAPN